MNDYKHKTVVIFDIDGTLFDTKIGILSALDDVSKEFGYTKKSGVDESSFIGPPIRDTFVKHFGMSATIAEKATIEYRKLYIKKYISYSELYDGMQKVLETLRNWNVCLAIATMKTKAQVEALLKDAPVSLCFDIVETALDHGGKTKADMINTIVNNLNLNKKAVWMVGDTTGDEKAAFGAGVNFIGVTYGYGYVKNEKHSFYVVDEPVEILDLIQSKLEY